MTASAKGCESVSASSCNDCGTPLSVRMKSSAASEKTTSPALFFTSAGTSTKSERAVRVGVCGLADDCSLLCALTAAANENQRNGATATANLNLFIAKSSPLSPVLEAVGVRRQQF